MATSIGMTAPPATGQRAWPPTAGPQRVELSIPAVLGILLAVYAAQMAVFLAAADGTSAFWAFGSVTEAAVRAFVVPSVIGCAIAVGVVLVLDWQRPAGLLAGTGSRWGVIPLALFLVAGVVTLGLPGAARDPGFAATLAIGFLVAAVFEEVLFRGFLLHGLARRLDAPVAVFVGSGLFAAAHMPGLVSARTPGIQILISLLALFGLAVLLCRIRAVTGSVWIASAVHALWNFITVGAIVWSASPGVVLPALGTLKLGAAVTGLVLAVRLGLGSGRIVAVPPMPLP